jgi:ribonuclease VapC
MVIDTSAIAAVLFQEPDAPRYAQCIARAGTRIMSAVTRVELTFVVEGRAGAQGRAAIEQLIAQGAIDIVSVTPEQADLAIDAFRRYGTGRHRAQLNIGDCFAYALAKATDLPLLFKGDDFAQTDIRPALAITRPT